MKQINYAKPARRVLAAILTVLLLLSLMPVTAIASTEIVSDNVCTISGGGSYPTLAEALAVVEDAQTITLLQDIPSVSGFMVSGKTIEINLNGKTLNISTSSQNGIEVQSGGALTISGGGQLNVNVTGAANHGLYASGTLTITSPCTVASANGIGVYAYSGDIFLQNASITGHGIGASAVYGSVNIVGDVAAIGGLGSHGVSAYSGGRVEITGSVSAGSIGVFVDGANSKIIVEGDVTTNQVGSLGVYAYDTAEATINGVITAVRYIQVGTTTKTVDDKVYPTTKFGYLTYTDFTNTVWVKDTTPSTNVCAIGGTEYATLTDALAVVTDTTPTTIRILQDIDNTGGIQLINKKVTFDLNGHTVNMEATGVAETALIVNGGSLNLIGSGELNIVGLTNGIKVQNNGTATVTNAKVTGGSSGIAAAAEGNGTLVVLGDAIATSYPDCAVLANFGGSVTVNGNTQSVWQAAFAGQPATSGGRKSIVYIKGNAISTATSAGSAAVHAFAGGEITIDGILTTDVPNRYIRVGNTEKAITDNTIPTTKTGYNTYTDGTSKVWVKDTTIPSNICEIVGGSSYSSLEAALAVVTNGQTVRLLTEINQIGGIELHDKSLTLDLNGHTLNVSNPNDDAIGLWVEDGDLYLTGNGELNVSGGWVGARVQGSGSEVTVTTAVGGSGNVNSVGAYVSDNGKLTVTGGVTGSRYGAYASSQGEIIIGGDAIATAPAPYDCFGAAADSGGVITVTGTAQSSDRGIYAYNPNSKITVGSVISTDTGINSHKIAVQVDNRAQVFILGDCTINAKFGTAVHVSSGGQATIDGTIHHDGVYVKIYTTIKDGSAASRTLPTTKQGYNTYSTGEGTVWVKDTTASSNVCAIGSTEYATLDNALAQITDATPTTITILKDIDHQAAISLVNKNITFDLNGHTVSISTDDARDTALTVNDGSLNLSGSGALNVTGLSHGVTVYNNANVTVTNVTIIGISGVDASSASLGGTLVVLGNTLCISDAYTISTGYAAYAETGGSVTVYGDARSYGVIACVETQGQVHIKGNVIEYPSDSYTSSGASASDGGQITIDGEITAERYLYVGHTLKTSTDVTRPTTKSGYHTYTDGTNTVWVKNTVALEVTGIAIKTQPSDLTYTAGQTLNLSGLVVTLDYNDGSTLDVDYEDFSFRNITANPTQGTAMAVATHHNQPVTLTCNGKSATTRNLTVTAVPPVITDPTPIGPPASSQAPPPSPTPTPVLDAVDIDKLDGSATIYIFEPGENGSIDVSVELPIELILDQIEGEGPTEEPFELNIPLTSRKLISIIKENEVQKVNLSVAIPDSILNNSRLATNILLAPDLLEAAIEIGSDVSITVEDDKGRKRYSWTFTGENLTNSNREMTEVNLFLEVEALSSDAVLGELLPEDSEAASGLIVNFAYEGVLPAQAAVRIYVGDQEGIDPGDRIYLYHYNTTTGRLETLPYSSGYVVDKEGYVTVNILHCSDYVMLRDKAGNDYITSLRDQISITPTNFTLYVGGTTGATAAIQVVLPATLELVKNMEMKTSGNAIGAVTAAYKSSNEKVATVNSEGMITAIGVGRARITTTITLYSGKTKTVVITITVKKPYLSFSKSSASMKLGEVFTFRVDFYGVKPDDIVWTTTKKSIVVINKKTGKAVAKSKGIDYVVAKVGKVSEKIKVVID